MFNVIEHNPFILAECTTVDDGQSHVATSKSSRSNRFMKKRSASPKPKEPRNKWPKGSVANLSRRQHNMDIYVFPHFDKCDSLLYFASSFSRHRNSGDHLAVYKLLSAHFDPRCKISYTPKFSNLSIRSLMKVFRCMDELMPDGIMCVYETKVVDNVIFSTAHAKFTDSQTLYDTLALTTTDPMFDDFFQQRREEIVLRKMAAQQRPKTAQESAEIKAIVEAKQDVIIHKRLTLTLTFDPVTKKVTEFVARGTVTSVESTAGVHEQQKIC